MIYQVPHPTDCTKFYSCQKLGWGGETAHSKIITIISVTIIIITIILIMVITIMMMTTKVGKRT